jgi:hypothetical protein
MTRDSFDIGLSPAPRAAIVLLALPGAYAPGFTLPSASRTGYAFNREL